MDENVFEAQYLIEVLNKTIDLAQYRVEKLVFTKLSDGDRLSHYNEILGLIGMCKEIVQDIGQYTKKDRPE